MKTKIQPSLSNAGTGDLFPNPDSPIGKRAPAMAKAGKRRQAASKPAKAASQAQLQPFLPGLSRRGRPRRKDAPAAAQRASESRERRLAAGARRIELMLEAAIAASLDVLAAHFGESRVELVSRLVQNAARRIEAKKNPLGPGGRRQGESQGGDSHHGITTSDGAGRK